jgi:hypothetical protein
VNAAVIGDLLGWFPETAAVTLGAGEVACWTGDVPVLSTARIADRDGLRVWELTFGGPGARLFTYGVDGRFVAVTLESTDRRPGVAPGQEKLTVLRMPVPGTGWDVIADVHGNVVRVAAFTRG